MNRVVLLLKSLEPLNEILAQLAIGVNQLPLFDLIDHSASDRACQRTSTEGCAVHAGLQRTCSFIRCEQCAKRQAARDRLGDCDDVRLDAVVLIREPLPSAAKTTLNFIDQEECAAASRESASSLEKFSRNQLDS